MKPKSIDPSKIRLSMERWRPVVGFEHRYEVSDQGRFRSITKRYGRTKRRMLHGTVTQYGYLQLTLYTPSGQSVTARAARLVLLAFVGQPDGAADDACHRDGDRLNNALSNLRWGTVADNEADKKLHGTHSRGESHGKAKLREEDVLRIRTLLNEGVAGVELAREYGVTPACISDIRTRKSWSHL